MPYGRADWPGAMRLGVLLLALLLVYWALTTNFVHSIEMIWLVFIPNVAIALWWAGLFAMVWIALEPYVRRLWPELLISWGRLFDKRFRDPMVGRDLLIGGLAGISMLWLEVLASLTCSARCPPDSISPSIGPTGTRHRPGSRWRSSPPLVGYGFTISLAGRPVFGRDLLEVEVGDKP